MDDLARTEYPGMLAHLQPGQATQTLNERVKRINKINLEIADWLQERRRVEEQYALGLRKLTQYRAPNSHSDLGVFQAPWARIIESVERIAHSHHVFAERIEQDVEHPLRAYQQRRDIQSMYNISSNLGAMAKDLEDAQDKADKLNRKGNKVSAQKVDAATSRLESATQQWESQAPFVFETLQALDESRVNQLRDLLTQYQTNEANQAQRAQDNAVEALAAMLEISTEKEIRDFAQRTTAGRPAALTRSSTRRSPAAGPRPVSSAGAPPSLLPGTTNNSTLSGPAPTASSQAPADDDVSDHNPLPTEAKPGSKLRRLGTMLGGRRRQSVHLGFGPLAVQKTGTTFGRLGSSHGRGISPRPSTSNFHQDSGRLSALAETPDQPSQDEAAADEHKPSHEGTNGVADSHAGPVDPPSSSAATAGGQAEGSSPESKDAEGFTIRAPMNDPISEAQREAAGEDADQLFKLNIQTTPVEEEDPQAKQAALSSVVNTLKLGPATRRSSTIRGRRDVRNTVYVPAPSSSIREGQSDGAMPSIAGSPPASSSSFPRQTPVTALASEASIAGTSDTQSVRSGNSLGSLTHAKHPDMTGPGLNSSIVETISAVFEDGVVKSASITGEIAFANNPSDSESKPHEIIRINNFPNLERIGPNRIFVQNSSPDQPDQFTLDASHLAKTATAFSYRVFAEEAEPPVHGQHAPLLLKPAWKPQGDKLGLLLQYQLNPSAQFTAPTTLHDVVLVARYEGKASGAQTKPSGTHLKDKHLVYWRLGDITLTGDMQKIVCRIVGADGVTPTAGLIEARWEYAATGHDAVGSGISISRLEETDKAAEAAEDDPFADQSQPAAGGQNWVSVPLQRKLVSGKYEGK
ncbi:fes/CIP4, and EFC/F-BAR-like domain-containing protein [Hirsutella rhossiliensis]|uniref:Fes/CIP4, and EFC/F-BAR-like domain-containing protein n=1 Tax=Hirsutella rhossiliensis TaxID=111463 RepID=A0A9P8SFU0_9HYPO|nr:fes/CIP4, and EFC/F-BAR-like domain-containing protein [Hirsutella rhossiliensis]KAH0961111.1 fes/CIP4, and EFC/F-BAR-like domain-containing protein [Hirsutella rhossiliensis]